MCLRRIRYALITVMGLIVTAYVWEQNGRVTLPELRICLPEHLSLIFFVKNAGQLRTVIVNADGQTIIFKNMYSHDCKPPYKILPTIRIP